MKTDIEKWYRGYLDKKIYRNMELDEIFSSDFERNEFDKPMIVLAEVHSSKKTKSGRKIKKARPVILTFLYENDKWYIAMLNKDNGIYTVQWGVEVSHLVDYEEFIKSVKGEEFLPLFNQVDENKESD